MIRNDNKSTRRATATSWLGIVAASLILPLAATAQETREITETVPLETDGRVSIKAFKGSINVTTWNRPEVEIRATIEPDGRSGRSEEAVEDTRIRIDDSATSVYIESDYGDVRRNRDDSGDWWNTDVSLPFVHYTIRVPSSAQLQVNDHKSEISITGLVADLRIDTHKSPIEIADVAGDIRMEIHKGRVDISGLSGGLDLDTHEGEVDVAFSGFTGRTRIETHKGEVRLSVPKGSGFELDADVGRKGDLRADFDLGNLEYRFGRRDEDVEYRGDVNGGGPLLRLRTYKGYFRIRER